MIRSVVSAVRTLTRFCIPGKSAENDVGALYFFPLVGAVIGGVVAAVAWLFGGLALWHAGAGAAGIAASVWMTGALHLDGLGDVADAVYGGWTREKRLEIMKDTHMGAFGTIAIALVLLLKTVSLTRLAAISSWLWIPIPFVLSRTHLVLLAVTLPYARRKGGTAAHIVENAKARHMAGASVLSLLLCWMLAGIPGLGAFVLSSLVALPLAGWMRRSFGGVTGDLLGMANELLECMLLFGAALILPLPAV